MNVKNVCANKMKQSKLTPHLRKVIREAKDDLRAGRAITVTNEDEFFKMIRSGGVYVPKY